MLKFAGCAVTVFCSAVWGYEKSRSLNRSLQLAISLTALVKRIGNDIDTLKKPLNDIYADYVDELLEEAGFLADLRERGFRYLCNSFHSCDESHSTGKERNVKVRFVHMRSCRGADAAVTAVP